MKPITTPLKPFVLGLVLTYPAHFALAQQAPDAGSVLQQMQTVPLQAPRPSLTVKMTPSTEMQVLPGGQKITLRGVKFLGQTVLDESVLLTALGDVKQQAFDLAGLRALASKISSLYGATGYPFARAFIPEQNFSDGVLTILVVEGRYGTVQAQGDDAQAAQDFLANLRSGDVIESTKLERATLILDDLPGITTTPVIRPGQEVGTGDLIVNIARESMLKGDVGFDNHGNRYTGQHRIRLNAQVDSPFMLGDQVTLRSLYSDENMWLGNVGYSLPLGMSGLRGNVGYAHTYYEQGKEFSALGAHGTAKVQSAGVSYPLLRSQKANLTIGATYQHKKLNDRTDSTGTNNDKESNSLPLSLQFDHRDSVGGGGITFGNLIYTGGYLKLDPSLTATDQASNTGKRGHFDKWNLDLARMQSTPSPAVSLYGRLTAQWARSNLDSSEKFSLGGADGVRAYPLAEGSGDKGWLIQLEARYAMDSLSPYVFYDAGKIWVNGDPQRITPAVAQNTRQISGAGAGIRYDNGIWRMDAKLAWRVSSGKPEADTRDQKPRLWLTFAYPFSGS